MRFNRNAEVRISFRVFRGQLSVFPENYGAAADSGGASSTRRPRTMQL
jgi:hypothetical protein